MAHPFPPSHQSTCGTWFIFPLLEAMRWKRERYSEDMHLCSKGLFITTAKMSNWANVWSGFPLYEWTMAFSTSVELWRTPLVVLHCPWKSSPYRCNIQVCNIRLLHKILRWDGDISWFYFRCQCSSSHRPQKNMGPQLVPAHLNLLLCLLWVTQLPDFKSNVVCQHAKCTHSVCWWRGLLT